VKRDLGTGHFNLAFLDIFDKQYEAAERHLESAIEAFRAVLDEKPASLENKHHLATCYRVLADLKAEAKDTTRALELYGSAKEQMAVLVTTNPEVAEYRATLAGLHMNVGLLHMELGRDAQQRREEPAFLAHALEARLGFSEARELLQSLVDEFPDTPRYREDLARTIRELAILSASLGKTEDVRGQLQEACLHFERVLAAHPDRSHTHEELSATRELLKQLFPEVPD
jgi:tetratricopeptide (TPR) repeat protein